MTTNLQLSRCSIWWGICLFLQVVRWSWDAPWSRSEFVLISPQRFWVQTVFQPFPLLPSPDGVLYPGLIREKKSRRWKFPQKKKKQKPRDVQCLQKAWRPGNLKMRTPGCWIYYHSVTWESGSPVDKSSPLEQHPSKGRTPQVDKVKMQGCVPH